MKRRITKVERNGMGLVALTFNDGTMNTMIGMAATEMLAAQALADLEGEPATATLAQPIVGTVEGFKPRTIRLTATWGEGHAVFMRADAVQFVQPTDGATSICVAGSWIGVREFVPDVLAMLGWDAPPVSP